MGGSVSDMTIADRLRALAQSGCEVMGAEARIAALCHVAREAAEALDRLKEERDEALKKREIEAAALKRARTSYNALVDAARAAADARAAQVKALQAEVAHWKGNHADMVAYNAALRERPGLSAERVAAVARLEEALTAATEKLADAAAFGASVRGALAELNKAYP